jgi:hypothetical protein
MHKRFSPLWIPLALVTLLAACDKPGAWGDVNALIVASQPGAWATVQDSVESALEPRVYTVRDEKAFRVTHVDPASGDWGNLSRFVQVVLIGSADEPFVQQALAERRGEAPLVPPQIVQVYDVWARGQQVTILLVEPGRWDQSLELMEPLYSLLDEQYRQWARNRMFISGADTALQTSLMAEAGFSLLLPEVYVWEARDSVYRFRNDNPDPSELIREVVVSWRTPIPEEGGREFFLDWRADLVAANYNFPQVVPEDGIMASPGTVGDRDAYQVQGIWENPPGEFPAAGPFILRAVECPSQNRLYLLDAWLYAPGKDKYEYMLQLETILNSFKCAD